MPRILLYPAPMPRKPANPVPFNGPHQADWHLPAWMATLGVTQADLCRETGMSKSTMSEIVNGKTHYYRALVNQLARALRVDPFELLLPPAEAMAIRRMRSSALSIAAESHSHFRGAPIEAAGEDDLNPRRAG